MRPVDVFVAGMEAEAAMGRAMRDVGEATVFVGGALTVIDGPAIITDIPAATIVGAGSFTWMFGSMTAFWNEVGIDILDGGL